MKKFLITLVAITSLIACKSKDDNDTPNQLIGGWKLVSFFIDEHPIKLTECNSKETIVFSENTLEILLFDYPLQNNCYYEKKKAIPYTISGNTLSTAGMKITFVIADNTLTIKRTEVDKQEKKKKTFSTTYRKISNTELAALRALELPKTITNPEVLIGGWKIKEITYDGIVPMSETCEEKNSIIFNPTTVKFYNFKLNYTTLECDLQKVNPIPYTASNGTFTLQGEEAKNFIVRGNELIISYKEIDHHNGKIVEVVYTYTKLTTEQLAELEKLKNN